MFIFKKECGTCSHYQAPPENFRGRADIGYCEIMADGVNDRDRCESWVPEALE